MRTPGRVDPARQSIPGQIPRPRLRVVRSVVDDHDHAGPRPRRGAHDDPRPRSRSRRPDPGRQAASIVTARGGSRRTPGRPRRRMLPGGVGASACRRSRSRRCPGADSFYSLTGQERGAGRRRGRHQTAPAAPRPVSAVWATAVSESAASRRAAAGLRRPRATADQKRSLNCRPGAGYTSIPSSGLPARAPWRSCRSGRGCARSRDRAGRRSPRARGTISHTSIIFRPFFCPTASGHSVPCSFSALDISSHMPWKRKEISRSAHSLIAFTAFVLSFPGFRVPPSPQTIPRRPGRGRVPARRRQPRPGDAAERGGARVSDHAVSPCRPSSLRA